MPTPDTAHDPTRRPIRVLVVDDNAEARRALETILTMQGLEVTSAGDGASAIAALGQSPTPDVLLVDLLLPDLDGLEVSRHTFALQPRPYVILITGWSFEADVRDVANSGVDQLYYKPLDVPRLVADLQRLRDSGRFG